MSLFGGGHSPAAQTPTRAMGIDLQGAQYGAPIPVVFGRNKLAANVIDYMDFQAIAHTQKQQGGKGGGGGQTSTSYTYSVSYLLGLAEGVGSIVSVYDGSSSTTLSAVGGLSFSGAAGQAPWAHLSGSHALGYSGTLLVAFQNKNLGSSASLPNYNFEVDGRNAYGGGIVDANPADIATAICTDTQIGVQFNALGDLTAFRDYCTAAGIFFSPVYATQNPAMQVLDDLFKYSNCAAFFSEGVLKVVPYGDETITGNGVTYTPNLTAVADLTRDDFITNGPSDPVTVKRIAPADAMNIQRVEFKDRANTYHTGTVVASIDQDVVGTGARADQSDSVDMITSAPVARIVVQNLLQRGFYIRNTYEFQLPWRYCYLEPMDIVTLTDSNTGLYLNAVRIIEIGEDEHGLLSGVAEEFPEGISHASTYATQPNAGTGVNPNADPGPITSPYLFRGPGFLVSNNQPEIWCALSGVDPLWAGCDVYLSHDGTSYTYLTTHSRRAAYGETTNSLAAGSDPDTTGAPNVVLNGPVELLGGTAADADQFVTLSMIDNELIAYQTATLAGGPSYTLGYLRRGGYGSARVAHSAAAPFVRLDENILRIPVDPSQIGQTVYLKFVSFNVFGKGGRTLADETAYTYVIGTNIELPDVPVTPASPAVTSVADGVSITWYNSNPAAVGCTSIEYATAAGGPWTVLAQVGPTTTAYAHHFTDGATYYYRLRSRGPVVAGGWSAYTAVLTNKGKTVADGADVTGDNVAINVLNPTFAKNTSGWTFSASPGPVAGGEFYQEATTNSPYPPIPSYLVHAGQAGESSAYADNSAYLPVAPGQIITGIVCLKSFSANAGAYAAAILKWYDASGTFLSITSGQPTCGPGGSYLQCNSKAQAPAPSNAAFVRLSILYINHTSGYINATACRVSGQLTSLDELPNGSTYIRGIQNTGSSIAVPNSNFQLPADSSGNVPGWGVVSASGAIFISTAAYHFGSQSVIVRSDAPNVAVIQCTSFFKVNEGDDVYVGGWVYPVGSRDTVVAVQFLDASGTYLGQTQGYASSGGWAFVSGHAKAPTGTVKIAVQLRLSPPASGSSFGYFNEIDVRVNDLRVAGSGARLGDLRNQVMVGVGNYASGWSGGSISYSASTTSATLSVTSATLQYGSQSLAYNAASTTVSGSAGSTVKFYLYYDDPSFTGGSKALNATTSQISALANDGRLLVGSVSVTFPTSGTGSGGGGTGCPQVDEPVIRRAPDGSEEVVRAGDMRVGDCLLLSSGRWGFVSYSETKLQPGVRVVGSDGSTITCSASAPLETVDGTCVCAPHVRDLVLKHRRAGSMLVAEVFDAGDIWVQHITCEDDCFWVGDYSHHNLKPGA